MSGKQYPLTASCCALMYLLTMLLIGISLAIAAAAIWSVTYSDENHGHPAIHLAYYEDHY